jgi:hypothetical protein
LLPAGDSTLMARPEAILAPGRLPDGELRDRPSRRRLALVAREGCADQRAMDGPLLFLVAARILGFGVFGTFDLRVE